MQKKHKKSRFGSKLSPKPALRFSFQKLTTLTCFMGFITFSVISPKAHAEVINPNGSTISSGGMNATIKKDPFLKNEGTVIGGYLFDNGSGNIDSSAAMYGFNNTANPLNFIFTNNGTLEIKYTTLIGTVSAYGMYAKGLGSHSLTNSNNITVTSTAQNYHADGANANAYGMYAGGEGNHTLDNSSILHVTATAGITNIDYVDADAYAYGMYANGTGNSTLTNSGAIYVNAKGGDNEDVVTNAYAYAYGMYAEGDGNHKLTNLNTIEVNATAGNAYGVDSPQADAYADAMRAEGNGDHVLINHGNITATAKGGYAYASDDFADAYAYARGMYASGDGDHTLTNYESITIEALAGEAYGRDDDQDADAYARGMYVENSSGNHKVTNFGTITTTAIAGIATSLNDDDPEANAYSYPIEVFGVGDHIVNNHGIINANATGGKVSADDKDGEAQAFATAIYVNGSGDHNITNHKSIEVHAQGGTIFTDDDDAHADAYATGVYVVDRGSHNVTNLDSITVTAIGGDATGDDDGESKAYSYGLSIENGYGSQTLINSGTITATSLSGTSKADDYNYTDAYAHGMYLVYSDGDHKITNSGTIFATATANEAIGDRPRASAEAYGVYLANSDGDHTVTNSGSIMLTATGGHAESSNDDAYSDATAYGMFVFGSSGDHSLINTGIIDITAFGGTAETPMTSSANATAYGMYITGTPTTAHVVKNYGIITAKTSITDSMYKVRAFEVYGEENYTVDTWATTLRTWSANDAVFALDNGRILTFANDTSGANLIIRPDTKERGFKLDTPYHVANMVAIDDGTGTMVQQTQFATGFIEGSIANVTTEVDFLTANLGGTATNPTVSLSLVDDKMPITTITAASLNTAHAHMKGVNEVTKNAIANVYNRAFGLDGLAQGENAGIAAGSNTLADMPKWTVFTTSYGSFTNNNEYDYDSDTVGVSGGITYNFNEKFALGGHFDFNTSSSDGDALESDSYSFAFGAHSHYFVNSNWYLSGSATFAFGNNDVEYEQSIGVADDDFSTFALFTGLHTGYVFEINENNLLVPEIGLSYLYSQNGDYSFDFGAHNMYNMNFDDNSYSNLYADLTLTWQGNFVLESCTLASTLGAGIRQNLTGSDIDLSYDLFNTRYKTTVTTDDTTFLTNAGLEWTKDNFSMSVDYKGEYGSEQTSHTGSLNFKYRF